MCFKVSGTVSNQRSAVIVEPCTSSYHHVIRLLARASRTLRSVNGRVCKKPSVKVPLDFTTKTTAPRIITNPDEVREAVLTEQRRLNLAKLKSTLSPRGPPLPTKFFETKESWFHPGLSRQEAENLFKLNSMREGQFLVRNSESLQGAFVLCVVHGGEVHHYPITSTHEALSINSLPHLSLDRGETIFRDLEQLVQFYELNAGALPTRLSCPIARVDVHNVTPSARDVHLTTHLHSTRDEITPDCLPVSL